MRINFSSKTKGSRKITPFYTIKAGKKSAFWDNRKCWSKKELTIKEHFLSVECDTEIIFFIFAWLILCGEAASSRHSFSAGINCRLIFGNDLGEPSRLHIVRTCSYHDCDVGPFGSRFSIYLLSYRDRCKPGTASPVCNTQHWTCSASEPPTLYQAIQTQCLLEPEGELTKCCTSITAFLLLLKKKKNLIAACWHVLPRETGYGYFSVDYLYSINNNSLSRDARKAMTNPATQEHSQWNKKHIVVAPTNCTRQHSFYQHLIWLGKNGLSQASIIVAHTWRWYGPHLAKHSLPLLLNMIIWTSFFFRNTFRYFWAYFLWAICSREIHTCS